MTDGLNLIAKRFAEGNAVHAYIVEGEKSNLPDLLKRCAQIAMCKEGGCGKCNTCRKISLEEHADWISLPRDKSKNRLTVDDINYLVEESIKRPVDSGDVRVFTVNASDSLSGAGATVWQNKLLKTLEEPVGGVYIFVGVTNCDGLLPTVISRCQSVKRNNRTFAEITQSLVAEGYNLKSAQYAAAMSNGDSENARKIIGDVSYFDSLALAQRLLIEMTSTKTALPVVSAIVARRDCQDKILAATTLLLRESLAYRLALESIILTEYKSEILKICENYSVAAAITCIEKINETSKRLQNGGNFTVEADNLAIEMAEVKYRCRI
ncbi:MAG: hypothetical protein NC350_06500 [Corallococcus sp.]|nr:hypothetical protein [Corallococcus sp.]